ncbi:MULTISPECIES: hypothetical protein [Microbacterium]|uniref:Integral membrane protein n=1 Tax=Microbacterium sufflavum TaxID=2851649 RepID=A0ABY4II43_9MICO|nr:MULTISPECIES: hypothetical protein [Microbacterium]UPL12247.1 hypothetical protein KV394_14515 [Microbacterium sufflavum]
MLAVALTGALVLLAALTLFQVALIFGAPLGRFAWGGAHRVLPVRLRVGSIVSVVLYAGFAALLLSRAGVIAGGELPVVVVLCWVLFAYFVIGILLNAISRSPAERWTMTPVCVMLAGMTLIVALS